MPRFYNYILLDIKCKQIFKKSPILTQKTAFRLKPRSFDRLPSTGSTSSPQVRSGQAVQAGISNLFQLNIARRQAYWCRSPKNSFCSNAHSESRAIIISTLSVCLFQEVLRRMILILRAGHRAGGYFQGGLRKADHRLRVCRQYPAPC